MPLGFDPDQVAEFSLQTDKDVPAEKRVVFQSKFLTCREVQRVGRIIEAYRTEKDEQKCASLISEALAVGIVGFGNAPIPWTGLDSIDDLLTPREKVRLAISYPELVSDVEGELRKKSLSPAPLNGVQAADTATPSVSGAAKESA